MIFITSFSNEFIYLNEFHYFCAGEMAERSNAAVLKTVDCNRSGGSNPSLSALLTETFIHRRFFEKASDFSPPVI